MKRFALVAVSVALGGCAGTVMQPVQVEQQTFALQLAAPGSVSAGERAPITVAIEGRGGFHVNLEYPVRIELMGTGGVALDKSTLAAGDASELSEQRARFETAARWSSAGRHRLSARAQFAVCTPDTCVPREETIAVAVDVR